MTFAGPALLDTFDSGDSAEQGPRANTYAEPFAHSPRFRAAIRARMAGTGAR